MSYQGDDPNQPRERQRSGTGFQQQPVGTQHQQSHGGGQPSQQRQVTQQWQGQTQQPGQPGQQQPTPQQQAAGQHQQGGHQPQQRPQQGAGQQQPVAQAQAGMTRQQTQTGRAAGGMAQQRGGQQQGMQAQSQRQRPIGGPQFAPMSVEQLIQTDVVTAQRDTPIASVAAALAEHNVGAIVIVEDDGETPVGVLTDRKIALSLEGTQDLAERTAGDLITEDIVTARTEMTVFEALKQLQDEGIRRLPVVDENGSLAGIVTLDDFIMLFGSALGDTADIIAQQVR